MATKKDLDNILNNMKSKKSSGKKMFSNSWMVAINYIK